MRFYGTVSYVTSVEDLESFLYVQTTTESGLNQMYSRTGILGYVLSEFSDNLQSLKSLAKSLRDVIFSKDVLQTGTRQGQPSVLYDKIVKALDNALDELQQTTD